MRTINQVESANIYKEDNNLFMDMQRKIKLFRNQRNAYISGFNVFLSLVLYRLFVTMRMMWMWREDLKEKEGLEKEKKKAD